MKLPETVTQNHDNQQKKVEVTPLTKTKDKNKADEDHIDSFRFGHILMSKRLNFQAIFSSIIQIYVKRTFHGRVHPRYQQIEMLDTVHRFLMPEQLQPFLSNHESMSKTGDISKGQGYDFILEEVNKGIKSWIRRGVASENMWLSVCRNYDQLNEIRCYTSI
ncbi:unnamed protein product [Mytilus edulis]|uniref:Uncharacterized protein n=1 Tax=Mytilus edulis TaxID=6550 RepID=A0A8S3PU38_MYTED|nr:unnamed protein product [Mytilus edulis]